MTHIDAEMQLRYKFANAPVSTYPFPHFFIRDIFPADFYRELQANLPDMSVMKPLSEVRNTRGYNERFVMDLTPQHLALLPESQKAFWETLSKWLLGGGPANALFHRFAPVVSARFKAGGPPPGFASDGLLIEDFTNYAIGPHTDSPNKVITVLFYLPKDDSQAHLGTSVYIPKDPNFRCPGGPHYKSDNFTRMHTAPFLPNSVFSFFKTDNSFHGVEPVLDAGCKRWLLGFNIYTVANPKPAD